jgi:hypothetical protein
MNYQIAQFFLYAAILVLIGIAGKRLNKRVRTGFIVLAIILLLVPVFLPRQLFGRWNSISALDGKVIAEIRLQPSLPNWKVNLVRRDFIITDKQQIDTITQLLRKTHIYTPSHPTRVWEANMIFITTASDTFKMQVNKTTNNNNGTYIKTPTNVWRIDEIGHYLERLTKYRQPVFGDKAKPEPVNIGD